MQSDSTKGICFPHEIQRGACPISSRLQAVALTTELPTLDEINKFLSFVISVHSEYVSTIINKLIWANNVLQSANKFN